MEREIHDIYDVILKIIATVYKNDFLRYIGIEHEIKKILNVELTTLIGRKLYLDFLCLLENDTLCHIEFQFRKANPDDLDRFFNYNITAQVRYQKLTDTILFNFTFKKSEEKTRRIGKSKSFHPKYFYLEEKDIEKTIQKINIKSKLKSELTSDEEITLMLLCLIPEWKNKAETLKKISKLLKNKNLFDETNLNTFKQ
ncbi:hypothetical protein [Methanobrevibacter sp.]|uniref:hypothetical protein n=1 Tax=Methanobrevibacter sp. TaxID=66852 RepID=UPI0026E02C3E|nr:hypothetical protein [Methanobrevibacter sp.]MDO5860045.1 hypothetical protein [Methanobrevibacter sp.]